MKAVHVKRTLDFVSVHSKRPVKELRQLLKNQPQTFINLLHRAVESAGSIPPSIKIFLENLPKETIQMKTQPKVSFGMKIIITFKKVVSKVKQFFVEKKEQVKTVVKAAAVACAAYVATGSTAIGALAAAIKGKGIVGTLMFGLSKLKAVVMLLKNFVASKTSSLVSMVYNLGRTAIAKLGSVKDYIFDKVKASISWARELVSDEPLAKAA